MFYGTDSVGLVLIFRSRWGAEDLLELGNQRFHSAQELAPIPIEHVARPYQPTVVSSSDRVLYRLDTWYHFFKTHVLTIRPTSRPGSSVVQFGHVHGSSICDTRVPNMSLTSTQCRHTIVSEFRSRSGGQVLIVRKGMLVTSPLTRVARGILTLNVKALSHFLISRGVWQICVCFDKFWRINLIDYYHQKQE